MLAQMVGPHELLAALVTLEPLLARVRSPVPLQLVRPGESFAAEQPRTDERTFARVPPEVGA